MVIYEMLAGRTPFAGDSAGESLANLINTEPPPLARFVSNVPDEPQRIVSGTLCKKKDERYGAMRELLADLKDLKDNLSFAEKLGGFGHFHHAAYIIACAYAALNRPEEAVRFLQMTADEGYSCHLLFATDAKLDAIRKNPKFRAFLEAQKGQWEYYKSLPKG